MTAKHPRKIRAMDSGVLLTAYAGTQSDRISLGVREEQRIGQPGTHGSPGTERRSQEGTMEDQEDATLHQSVLGSINYGS